jgi:fructuronate reductase
MLGRLPTGIGRPAYDRARIAAGVVHIGVGAFHRAHQAAWFDEILSEGDLRWGVQGVSLRSPTAEQALNPQDGLYTLVERSAEGETIRVRGAIAGVITAAGRERDAVAALAAPETHLVSLTITEKGYVAEAADNGVPTTAAGLLAQALSERRAAGLAPFTVLSCDNLDDNGGRIRALVLEAASRIDPALAGWVEQHGAFPSSMVDRITPATTDEKAALEAQLGYRDEAIVTAEHFRQWVIEDRFAGPRPDFAAVGVQVVSDVIPWQAAKLRLLNGAHSALAYLGALAGFTYVHDAIGWPPMRLRAAAMERGGAHPDADAGARSGHLSGRAAETLRQSPPRPSPDPDRHGRLAETAAAPPGHDP